MILFLVASIRSLYSISLEIVGEVPIHGHYKLWFRIQIQSCPEPHQKRQTQTQPLPPRSTKTMLLQHTISYTRTSRARRRSRRPRSRLEHPAHRAPTGRRRAPQWYRTHYTGGITTQTSTATPNPYQDKPDARNTNQENVTIFRK
jgi:hypothetical protein